MSEMYAHLQICMDIFFNCNVGNVEMISFSRIFVFFNCFFILFYLFFM